MTVQDLILSSGQRNDDPDVKMMLDALPEKFQKGFSEVFEAEKRSRSLVISGIEEPPEGSRPSERRKTSKARSMTSLMPLTLTAVLRKPSELEALVIAAKVGQARAAINFLLASSIRQCTPASRSITEDERKRQFELRSQARELNKDKSGPKWVVYREQLTRVCDLPQKPGNV
ncbi:hypothetical protein ANCDUO_14850 [Ancylostoma duodenale]|uniref:Uncharacterized protein n=1 Tax=Ancylostoma duodenale TaxID=51022 RepID=A0A0C2GD57_9BILA|nr:hypothetical protein ANCDUO_14850 [Ancylostoma duodenale]